MSDVLRTISTRRTPQSQPAGGASVRNAAGGYVFAIDDIQRLRRFLTLGSAGGTYYTSAPELTRDNAAVVIGMAENDPVTLVDTIVEISTAGRAPRQNPAIFALAVAASSSDEAGRAYALAALPKVCRTGTHLYLFTGYVEQFRGWGRALKRAVGNWYVDRPVDKLAYQVLKYRQREGWTHRDLLRLARPNPGSPERNALFGYICKGSTGNPNDLFPAALVRGFEFAQAATDKSGWLSVLRLYPDLSWEMLPDAALTVPEVWEALITNGMPQTALMRQLPRLTRLGVTTGQLGTQIANQLQDAELLKRGRVHPINVLVAQRTYASGAGARGQATWTPTPKITDALDAAFYNAYGAVEPAGKRILLACDVSGSMSSAASGLPLSCREAVAALSLVTLNVEKDAEIIGFSDGRSHGGGFGGGYFGGGGYSGANAVATRLDVSPRRRLDDVCSYMAGLNFGRTDCALPYLWAQQNRLDFDAVVTLTDNETWFGNTHPHQALRQYREHVGHDVKSLVVAMTSTGYSIADPKDPSSLDVAGFDSNVPQVISNFSAGLI